MPLYKFHCPVGCEVERFLTLAQHKEHQTCFVHGYVMLQIITAPLLVKASANVCYDSPIDGKPVTSWAQRREDLKRHNCTEYDPECKVDRANRLKESEAALDRTIDEHVERTIAKMPTAQRGKLYSELTEQGVQAEVVRSTPHA